jgi:type I restriction enzyme S subunit
MNGENGLYELPKGWVWIKLKRIGEVITGTTPSKKDSKNYGDYIPFVKPPQLNDCIISEAKDKLSKKGVSLARILPPNSVLVSCIGILGKTGITKIPIAFNQQINAIIFLESILPKYGFYYFQTLEIKRWLYRIASATTIPIVNKSKFETTPIALSPFQEQQRIVSKIEELFTNLDAGKSALTQIKKQLKNYRQSLLKYAFEGKLTEKWRKTYEDELEPASVLLEKIKEEQKNNEKGKKRIYKENSVDDSKLYELPEGWVWIYFNEIIHKSQNGFSKRFSDIGILTPVIRLANIHNHKINAEDIRSIKMSKNEREKYLLKKKDILLIRVNGTKELVGSANMFNLDGDFAFCDHFIRYSLWKDYIIVKYISSYLNTKFIRKYINSRIVSTAGQNTINQKNFGNLPIPLPPFLEQKQIMEILEQKFSIIDELEKITEINLMKAKRLRQSILKKAFKGSLVPQDTTDEPAHLLLERIKAQKDKEKNNKRKSKKNRTDSNQTRLIDYDK